MESMDKGGGVPKPSEALPKHLKPLERKGLRDYRSLGNPVCTSKKTTALSNLSQFGEQFSLIVHPHCVVQIWLAVLRSNIKHHCNSETLNQWTSHHAHIIHGSSSCLSDNVTNPTLWFHIIYNVELPTLLAFLHCFTDCWGSPSLTELDQGAATSVISIFKSNTPAGGKFTKQITWKSKNMMYFHGVFSVSFHESSGRQAHWNPLPFRDQDAV